jgi:hypothetical protein
MRLVLLVRHLLQLQPEPVPIVRLQLERDAAVAVCEVLEMNIAEEEDAVIEARTCGDKNKRVAYKFMNGFHSLCLDKKDILLAEIGACEMLLRACHDDEDKKAVEKEIAELKMALDLMP